MAFKADPPDFLDSGSYNITDVSGWGSKMISWTLGAVLMVVALTFGISFGGSLSESLSGATGMDQGSGEVSFAYGGNE